MEPSFTEKDIDILESLANGYANKKEFQLIFRYQLAKLEFQDLIQCCKPKFHKLAAHLRHFVVHFGALLNGSTQVVERLHKPFAKHFYVNSSHKDSKILYEFNSKVFAVLFSYLYIFSLLKNISTRCVLQKRIAHLQNKNL